MGAERQKDIVGKQVEEVDTVGETVGVEESFSASTFEGHGSNLGMTQSKCETTEENVGNEEVVANDEKVIEVESQPIAGEIVSGETAGGSEASQNPVEHEEEYEVEYQEKNLIEKEEEEGHDNDEAYQSCVEEKFLTNPNADESATIEKTGDLKASPASVECKEEDRVEKVEEVRDDDEAEERDEDVKQEAQARSIVSKADAAATRLSHIVSESQSETREATNEGDSPSAPTCSIASTSSSEVRDQSVNKPSEAATSSRLASMMGERLKAMENIRNLLKSEREQENGMRVEFLQKVRVLEDDIGSKDESIFELKTKNADHVRQLNRLTATINELVNSNHATMAKISDLEQDVAAKTDTIQGLHGAIQDKQSALDMETEENMALTQQLETFKAENDDFKDTVEDLEAKNNDYANELEVLMSSLQELVDQNTALEGELEKLIDANKILESELIPVKQENIELLDTVDDITASLNEANVLHTKEIEELEKENEETRRQMKEEQDANAATTRQLEKVLEDTTAQMEDQLAAQKAAYEKQVVSLTKALEEATASCQKKANRNEKLQKEIADIGRTAAKSTENAASTIAQLEKDLEEEFQISTQLKRGMESLKKKAEKDDEDKYTDDLEDLLSSMRMIQCWQLSHFQRINKLASENREQARNIQLFS